MSDYDNPLNLVPFACLLLVLSIPVSCAMAFTARTPVPYPERYDALHATSFTPVPDSLPIPGLHTSRAWAEAGRLLSVKGMPVPKNFVAPPAVRVRQLYMADPRHRLFGIYLKTPTLKDQGRMGFEELVVVFAEEDCLVEEILVHEYLHALHARLMHTDARWAGIDHESFVESFSHVRSDWPNCPEERQP